MNSEAAFIARAVHLRSTDKLVNSRECLTHVTSALNAQSFYAWLMLSQVYYKLYCWEETENASRQALKLLKSRLKDKFQLDIKLRLLEAMSRSSNKQKLTEARQMCEEVNIVDEYILKLFYICFYLISLYSVVKDRAFCTSATDTRANKCDAGRARRCCYIRRSRVPGRD